MDAAWRKGVVGIFGFLAIGLEIVQRCKPLPSGSWGYCARANNYVDLSWSTWLKQDLALPLSNAERSEQTVGPQNNGCWSIVPLSSVATINESWMSSQRFVRQDKAGSAEPFA